MTILPTILVFGLFAMIAVGAAIAVVFLVRRSRMGQQTNDD